MDNKRLDSLCRDYFYQYGDVRNLKVVGNYAFIEYTTREAAETAAERSFNKTYIKVTSPSFSPFSPWKAWYAQPLIEIWKKD